MNEDLVVLVERLMGGWTILIGLSHLFQRRRWLAFVEGGEDRLLLGMFIGMVAVLFGGATVLVSPWGTGVSGILTSMLGWLILAKGVGYTLAPAAMLARAPQNKIMMERLTIGGGCVAIVLGAVISVGAWS